MQEKYYQTEHSIKAYQEVCYPHPTKSWDLEYPEKCRQYPKVVDKIITKAIRVQIGPQGDGEKPKEYLAWTELEVRMNDLENKDIVVRTNLGLYPILEPHYIWKWGEEGNKEKAHDRQPDEYLGYYQPWNKSTKKEISKYVLKSQDYKRKLQSTQFFLQKEGEQQKMTVSFEDFMSGSFDKLYKPFQHKPIERAPATS